MDIAKIRAKPMLLTIKLTPVFSFKLYFVFCVNRVFVLSVEFSSNRSANTLAGLRKVTNLEINRVLVSYDKLFTYQ